HEEPAGPELVRGIARRPEPRVQLDWRGAGGGGGLALFQRRGNLLGARLELDGLCPYGHDKQDDQRAGHEGPHCLPHPGGMYETVMICQGRGMARRAPTPCGFGPAWLYSAPRWGGDASSRGSSC